MNPVVHFEMPYGDQTRVAKFYQSAFGWQTQAMGEALGGYVLATTAEMAGNTPKTPCPASSTQPR